MANLEPQVGALDIHHPGRLELLVCDLGCGVFLWLIDTGILMTLEDDGPEQRFHCDGDPDGGP